MISKMRTGRPILLTLEGHPKNENPPLWLFPRSLTGVILARARIKPLKKAATLLDGITRTAPCLPGKHETSVDQKEHPMAQTILYENRETTVDGARAEGDHLWVPLVELQRSTGWKLESQGLCREKFAFRYRPTEARLGRRGTRQLDFAAFADTSASRRARRRPRRMVLRSGDKRQGRIGKTARLGPGPGAPISSSPTSTESCIPSRRIAGRKAFLFCWASW